MHVAIIMDGNGRWAARRGLTRTAGHRAGANAVRRVVEAAARADLELLTLYAFSSDNWSRPAAEVDHLMKLFKRYLQSETARCVENGVRLNVIGRRDRLSRDLVNIIEQSERLTAGGRRLTLRLAVDYSAREAIARAAMTTAEDAGPVPVEPTCGIRGFARRMARETHSRADEADVDLLIRTGGESRLSDFLLWECAYAELVFVEACWPDFDEAAFAAALVEYRRRERRFGRLPENGSVCRSGETR